MKWHRVLFLFAALLVIQYEVAQCAALRRRKRDTDYSDSDSNQIDSAFKSIDADQEQNGDDWLDDSIFKNDPFSAEIHLEDEGDLVTNPPSNPNADLELPSDGTNIMASDPLTQQLTKDFLLAALKAILAAEGVDAYNVQTSVEDQTTEMDTTTMVLETSDDSTSKSIA